MPRATPRDTAYCEYRQRDWSWTKSHIATLWDSLFKGHPIGLFTQWPCYSYDILANCQLVHP